MRRGDQQVAGKVGAYGGGRRYRFLRGAMGMAAAVLLTGGVWAQSAATMQTTPTPSAITMQTTPTPSAATIQAAPEPSVATTQAAPEPSAVTVQTTSKPAAVTVQVVPKPTVGRPEAGAGPTKVFVTVWVADIDNIDSANQRYVANVYVGLRWSDPRLAHGGEGPRSYDLNSIWDPRVIVANEIGIVRKTLPETAEVMPSGVVVYRQRYVGVFSQVMNLKEFPLDSHVVRFHLVSPGQTPEEVEFVAEDRWATMMGSRFAAGAGIAEEISLPDWDIQWCRTRAMAYTTVVGVQTAGYVFEFEARRHRGYFFGKLMLPMMLIILMSWLVFWIDRSNAGAKIGVATTAMLTLIAYRFALDQSVPRVGYLTRMDYFVMGGSMLVFLALCQVVLTAWLTRSDRERVAHRVDVWSRVVFLALLVGLMIVSFAL